MIQARDRQRQRQTDRQTGTDSLFQTPKTPSISDLVKKRLKTCFCQYSRLSPRASRGRAHASTSLTSKLRASGPDKRVGLPRYASFSSLGLLAQSSVAGDMCRRFAEESTSQGEGGGRVNIVMCVVLVSIWYGYYIHIKFGRFLLTRVYAVYLIVLSELLVLILLMTEWILLCLWCLCQSDTDIIYI